MRPSPRVLAVMLAFPAWGCMEMIFGLMQGSAKFERACGPATVNPGVPDVEADFRAYDGPIVKRPDVAVVVVPAISDSCVRPHYTVAYWTPYIASVDERRKVLGPDRKTGKERQQDFPKNCVTCSECLRLALLPGPRVMQVGVWSWGSANQKYTDLRGSTQFEALAGGLYSVQACQPGPKEPPLFWVRDERTLQCVSSACPEGPKE